MGSSVPTEEPMGDEGFGDAPMGGEPEANDKPFDDTPFDAGVESNEDENPEKYIQQLSGKLGQSLRKYTDEMGQPDYDLEKFAINSVLSATNSGEMDQQDQNDIINKVKGSSTDGSGGDGEDAGMPNPDDMPNEEPTGGEEADGGEELDFSDIDMEEGFNPNGNGNTVFQDMTLGVKDGGMEENKYLNLESTKKSSIFVSETKTIKNMIRQILTETPVVTPKTKPATTPTRTPSRRSKPWTIIPESIPNPEPKGEVTPISFIRFDKFTDNDVLITFDVGDVRFTETFTNTGETIETPEDYNEPWVYKFESDVLSNGKAYSVAVDFYGNPHTNLKLYGFNGGHKGKVGEIEEV